MFGSTSRRLTLRLLSICTCSLAAAGLPAAEDVAVRVGWTTSRLAGSPDPPPPYQVEPAFPQHHFNRPVVVTTPPDRDRMFVAEQGGQIFSFDLHEREGARQLAFDLKQVHPDLQAVYGLTFDPHFADNRFLYICYILRRNQDEGTRVSRFRLATGDPWVVDPNSEHVLLTWRSGGHNGGCLKFGPDGYLYISTGDAAAPTPPDGLDAGQDVSNLLSAILRIDVTHTAEDRPYQIPPDNPFADLEGARPEIWSYGFRNPWKMSFDRETGDLWVGDVGWELWEMIYRVKRGGNYGWSIVEGRQSVRPEQEPGPTPILPPTLDHPHSEAGSITGGFVYRGSRLPDLHGVYIYGDYQSGIIWGARLEGDAVAWRGELARTSLQLVGFGEDTAGELYLLDYQGQIYRLAKNPEEDRSATFPRRLSETGLFTSLQPLQPASGVVPYSINVSAWADGTHAERLLAVPGQGQITIDEDGDWHFPDGSVVLKTISMDALRIGEAAEASFQTQRLETQVLHREAGSWRPYTYLWNESQTDAVLADSRGSSRTLVIRDPNSPDGLREQPYRFAGRQECVLCHNPWVEARTTIFGVQSASLLGVHASQLNRPHDDQDGTVNQLDHLVHDGLLAADVAALRTAPPLVDPHDAAANLAARVRSYFHVNCAHCHQFNAGGVATIVLSRDVPLADARLLDERPAQGAFGISDARIVAPGDPSGSVLLYRMAKLGGGRMPRLGSHAVDDRGVKLIHDWIRQLPRNSTGGDTVADPAATFETLLQGPAGPQQVAAIMQQLSSTRAALALATQIAAGHLSPQLCRQIAEATRQNASSQIRDLFERHLPLSLRIKRLGDQIDAAALLALPADAERGRAVFLENATAACKNCHRIGNVGVNLGPDLSQIGKKYPRHQLLEQILEPSKFMEPNFVPYLLETSDGRILSGLLAEQTERRVVLVDARNQRHTVARKDIELLVRQQKSLMPDLLVRDMTAQEVADLLAFLAQLK